MKQRNLIILRGVSGSGKSTFCDLIQDPKMICCADDYFTDSDGNYNWNAASIGLAHKFCRDKFDRALNDDFIENIIIANTNTKPSDWKYFSENHLDHP